MRSGKPLVSLSGNVTTTNILSATLNPSTVFVNTFRQILSTGSLTDSCGHKTHNYTPSSIEFSGIDWGLHEPELLYCSA
jgi:hypothetical protein